eukprot:8797503-Pyramimonas_sp.AAC.1
MAAALRMQPTPVLTQPLSYVYLLQGRLTRFLTNWLLPEGCLLGRPPLQPPLLTARLDSRSVVGVEAFGVFT